MSLRSRVLGSGSGGNATLVEGGGARVLLDAGLGPRQLADRVADAGVDPASVRFQFHSLLGTTPLPFVQNQDQGILLVLQEKFDSELD